MQICGRMLPYYGTVPYLTKLMDSIENEGRSTCALLAPHNNLEMPGGAVYYACNSHTQPINAVVVCEFAGWISVSDKLVYVSQPYGEIVTDTKPKTLADGDHFTHLTLVLSKKGYK